MRHANVIRWAAMDKEGERMAPNPTTSGSHADAIRWLRVRGSEHCRHLGWPSCLPSLTQEVPRDLPNIIVNYMSGNSATP
jgi:hypothetical protein